MLYAGSRPTLCSAAARLRAALASVLDLCRSRPCSFVEPSSRPPSAGLRSGTARVVTVASGNDRLPGLRRPGSVAARPLPILASPLAGLPGLRRPGSVAAGGLHVGHAPARHVFPASVGRAPSRPRHHREHRRRRHRSSRPPRPGSVAARVVGLGERPARESSRPPRPGSVAARLGKVPVAKREGLPGLLGRAPSRRGAPGRLRPAHARSSRPPRPGSVAAGWVVRSAAPVTASSRPPRPGSVAATAWIRRSVRRSRWSSRPPRPGSVAAGHAGRLRGCAAVRLPGLLGRAPSRLDPLRTRCGVDSVFPASSAGLRSGTITGRTVGIVNRVSSRPPRPGSVAATSPASCPRRVRRSSRPPRPGSVAARHPGRSPRSPLGLPGLLGRAPSRPRPPQPSPHRPPRSSRPPRPGSVAAYSRISRHTKYPGLPGLLGRAPSRLLLVSAAHRRRRVFPASSAGLRRGPQAARCPHRRRPQSSRPPRPGSVAASRLMIVES